MIQTAMQARPDTMHEANDQTIQELARQRLAENRSYALCFRDITIEYEDGVLLLRGRLPSFYMKQVLQTLLRDLDGVEQIDNQTDVVTATGLSSVPKPG